MNDVIVLKDITEESVEIYLEIHRFRILRKLSRNLYWLSTKQFTVDNIFEKRNIQIYSLVEIMRAISSCLDGRGNGRRIGG